MDVSASSSRILKLFEPANMPRSSVLPNFESQLVVVDLIRL